MDRFDRKIAGELAHDGKLTMMELAGRVGLSPSACTRRVQNLERQGLIRGYRAMIDRASVGLGVSVFVEITLERQNSSALRTFEQELMQCSNVLSCHLMSGTSDYLIHIAVDDLGGFERLHSDVLGHLPGVARIESKFSLRQVVDRPVTPIVGTTAPAF